MGYSPRGRKELGTTERPYLLTYLLGFLGDLAVKSSSAMQEIQVRSLGWENPLEKRMVTHSSIVAWRIPWTEEPGGLQSMVLQRVGHD